ncbi:MAG: DUF202 domain-containing protein [Actinomycetota bacterium]
MKRQDRPRESFDVGLQHERTALAWERTSIATMVAGVIFARYAAEAAHPGLAVIGLLQVAAGASVLVWAGWHYEELHGPLRRGTPVVHPRAARFVGLSTVAFSGLALALVILDVGT